MGIEASERQEIPLVGGFGCFEIPTNQSTVSGGIWTNESAPLCLLQAKRYLVYKDPAYHAGLTPASQGTLVCQGGRMSQEEAEQFEQLSNFQVGTARLERGGGRS